MRCRCSGWLVLSIAGAACAGVTPLPAELAAREFTAAATDPAELARSQELEQTARAALDDARDLDAERLARESLAIDPRRARARAVLGHAMVRQASSVEPSDFVRQQLGEGELLTAARQAPDDPVVALLQARALARIGHLSAAAAAAEDRLSRLPRSADDDYLDLVQAAAGWCYELGEERRALPHLRVVVGSRGDDASAWYRLGSCLLRTAEAPAVAAEAAAAFERAAQQRPDDLDAHLGVVAARARLAELEREAGAADAAVAALGLAAAAAEAAALRFPAAAEPWFQRGVITEQQGDATAARGAYEQALQRDPEHLGALLNLALLFAAAGDPQAQDLWRRALRADEGRGQLQPGERARIEAALRR